MDCEHSVVRGVAQTDPLVSLGDGRSCRDAVPKLLAKEAYYHSLDRRGSY